MSHPEELPEPIHSKVTEIGNKVYELIKKESLEYFKFYNDEELEGRNAYLMFSRVINAVMAAHFGVVMMDTARKTLEQQMEK